MFERDKLVSPGADRNATETQCRRKICGLQREAFSIRIETDCQGPDPHLQFSDESRRFELIGRRVMLIRRSRQQVLQSGSKHGQLLFFKPKGYSSFRCSRENPKGALARLSKRFSAHTFNSPEIQASVVHIRL